MSELTCARSHLDDGLPGSLGLIATASRGLLPLAGRKDCNDCSPAIDKSFEGPSRSPVFKCLSRSIGEEGLNCTMSWQKGGTLPADRFHSSP